jgi:peptidoglycan lytic transglycosylase
MTRIAILLFVIALAVCSLGLKAGIAADAPGAKERFEQALTDFREANYHLAFAGAGETARLFPGTVWEGRALFLAGMAGAALGELDIAAKDFALSKDKEPELADYVDFIMANAYMDAGMTAEAIELYISAAKARPDGAVANESLLRAGRALDGLKDYARSSEVLKTLVGKRANRPTMAEALYLLAMAEANSGSVDEAFGRYDKLMLDYPESGFVKKAAEALKPFATAEKPLPAPDIKDRMSMADILSSLGYYKSAADEYEDALAGMPDDYPKRGDALMGLGYNRYKARKNGAAIDTLLGIADSGRYPDKSPEALYWLARTYLRLGNEDKFRAAANRCADEYPGSERAADCLLALGVEFAYDGKYQEALDVLKRLTAGYRHSDDYPDAVWRMGWTQFLAGDYRASEETLRGLYERFPDSDHTARGMYWRARALGALGKTAESGKLYKELEDKYGLSYYGVLAENPGARLTAGGEAQVNAAPQDDPVAASSNDRALNRALELGAVGLEEYGVRDLMKVERRYSSGRSSVKTLAAAYAELGEYKRPLEMAERLYRTRMRTGRTPIPDDMMRIIFPDGFWDVITREAKAFGVDPCLVAALVREESHFDPRVVSPAGAMGLMQLMPKTAALVCRKLGRPKPTEEGLRQGEYNLPLGICHLGYLLDKHDGRLVYALAEYNAGSTALGRWMEKIPDATDDVFVENIGYPETRGYVRRVIRNYGIYRRLYGAR